MTPPLPIYLDYNGTTPHDPAVNAAMRPFIETEFGNPSSSHWYGIAPKQAVARARRQVADLLGGRPAAIVFTSGGTESNNHAIGGVERALRDRGRHIVTTAVEHPAVLEVCRDLATQGFELTVEISHVLVAMGLDPDWAKGTLRFSVGRPTTEADIDRAAEVVCEAVERLYDP
ncbi:MAG: aminotransferase class V-fold PLP-dependent enzyme [Desulfobacteraceae bacterium]|jgi:cysteine sulfinate desulfinase/cysteine desulfurase-like protein|nr:aminotransferase class V-fold PLP-dependent enzyme [Desulfobacteraceae bacterium]